jgi:hypothetical protein
MQMVLNKAYGGFGFGVVDYYEDFVSEFEGDRTAPELVAFVEGHPHECGDLAVVEIPDTATDWEMDEYDGWESITYVVDGKIHHT